MVGLWVSVDVAVLVEEEQDDESGCEGVDVDVGEIELV